MGLAETEPKKDEKIDGVIYDMSPAPDYRHGIVNGNIYIKIKRSLKDSICLVSIENLDFKYHPDKNDDYLCPDIMIICDRKYLIGGSHSGVPKFIIWRRADMFWNRIISCRMIQRLKITMQSRRFR